MLLALVDFDLNFWGNSGIAPEKSQFSPIFWGYPRFTPDFWGYPRFTPPKGFFGIKKNITPCFWDLPHVFGIYPKILVLPENCPRFLRYIPKNWDFIFFTGVPCDHCIFEFWKLLFSLFGSCDRKQSRFLKRLHFNGNGPCFSSRFVTWNGAGRWWLTTFFFVGTDWAPRAMKDDDFVEEVTQKSISKMKSVSKSDAQFVKPCPGHLGKKNHLGEIVWPILRILPLLQAIWRNWWISTAVPRYYQCGRSSRVTVWMSDWGGFTYQLAESCQTWTMGTSENMDSFRLFHRHNFQWNC